MEAVHRDIGTDQWSDPASGNGRKRAKEFTASQQEFALSKRKKCIGNAALQSRGQIKTRGEAETSLHYASCGRSNPF